jgi:hypothetical protein
VEISNFKLSHHKNGEFDRSIVRGSVFVIQTVSAQKFFVRLLRALQYF